MYYCYYFLLLESTYVELLTWIFEQIINQILGNAEGKSMFEIFLKVLYTFKWGGGYSHVKVNRESCPNGLVFPQKIFWYGSHFGQKSLDEGLISQKFWKTVVKSAVFDVENNLQNGTRLVEISKPNQQFFEWEKSIHFVYVFNTQTQMLEIYPLNKFSTVYITI